MNPALVAALAAGATVVTPNKRLARHLVETHDRARVASGARAWPAARVLPWTAWVVALEDEAVARGRLAPRVRMSDAAAALLWRDAIEEDDPAPPDVGGLARLAAEAWSLLHEYGHGASWRAWSGGAGEAGAFARWADRFADALERRGASDGATAPDRVAAVAAAWSGAAIVFAGFLAPTPQHRRLSDALAAAGATVGFTDATGAMDTRVERATCASPAEEWRAAFAWARARVERAPDERVAIVVPELAQRLDAVRASAIDVLGWPDDGMPAWNLSLGRPLAQVPRVAAALDLAALAWGMLPVGRAAALLRSETLPGAATMMPRRATLERRWLDAGFREVGIDDARVALAGADDPIAGRFASIAMIARRTTRATRHGWVDAWREAWRAAGWPGDRTSTSVEWQAEGAFDEALAAWAALDAWNARGRGTLAAEAALAEFAAEVAAMPFQPEQGDSPVQVLGLYEALGLPFDALWVTGMDDATLPPATRPHPLLPADWQRERGVPRSDPATERARAEAMAAALLRAAPVVVTSHAAQVEDEARAPSRLFDAIAIPVPALAPAPSQARLQFVARPGHERRDDAFAPALEGERIVVRGGASVLQAQSDCPFQALAAVRWDADRWPTVPLGWSARERGILLHRAFDAFWHAVGDRSALLALRADGERYRAALEAAADVPLRKIPDDRRDRLPPIVFALERDRLVSLLDGWLEAVDAARPDFAVVQVEDEARAIVGPLDLGVRYDRVDRLGDGGFAVIDYKTGKVPALKHWRGTRPRAVQIALYALALGATRLDEPLRAAVMAQVRRGETKAIGLYADEAARFVEPRAKEAPTTDWPALQAEWSATLTGLAQDFARGAAAVDPRPRDGAVCRTCARQALCRIDADDGAPADEDEEEA